MTKLSDKLRKSGIQSMKDLADYADKTEVEKARLVRFLEGKADADHCYEMGLDYARNGANKLNCHFGIFTTDEGRKAWEKGKADAQKGQP